MERYSDYKRPRPRLRPRLGRDTTKISCLRSRRLRIVTFALEPSRYSATARSTRVPTITRRRPGFNSQGSQSTSGTDRSISSPPLRGSPRRGRIDRTRTMFWATGGAYRSGADLQTNKSDPNLFKPNQIYPNQIKSNCLCVNSNQIKS